MKRDTMRFGVIGLGMMGREFASAAARWNHLEHAPTRPRIVSICSEHLDPEREAWFRSIAPSVEQATRDYREVIANPDVDALYVAVPHHLHREIYVAALQAGKHLMGEKPFGIDASANAAIVSAYRDALRRNPNLVVRCATQFAFIPGMQYIGRAIAAGEVGRIIEVEAGFLHSSDLNPHKPINWKRRLATNGEYGAMGDLGMHVCHIPFRAGWYPANVRAVLSNIVAERPDGAGGTAPCETWDNASILTEVRNGDSSFPMTLKTFRIAPGETNTLYLNVLGTKSSLRFSTRSINVVERLTYDGGEQNWTTIDLGHTVSYPSITAPIFEFGFSDAILQMWAAFMSEIDGTPPPNPFARCATVEEVARSHALFTAALESNRSGETVAL